MTVDEHLRHPALAPDRRRLLLVMVAAVLLLAAAVPLGLRARSGGVAISGDASAGGSASAEVTKPATGAAPDQRDAAGSPASSGSSASVGAAGKPGAAAAVVTPKIARSAWLGIQVSDLSSASGRVRAIAGAAGGQVTAENVVTAPDPTGGARPGPAQGGGIPPVEVDQALITVRVPAGKLDAVLTELARLGSVSYRSSQAEDVTDAYVDTAARIPPMRDSVERVRALLAKATDLQQVVLLESELSRRQADLDSLQQRLAELDRRTSTSDVTVTLWTASTPASRGDDGFVGALRDAWTALLGSLGVILTGLAVLLPWLVIALVAAVLVRRGLRRRRGPSAPAGTAAS
ncbi:MAG TPA: DUF4349 domain-containing protein [Intrasporangium sp.]|uniref:DUF4349 domain-containing protein n=1 Tax=Intrasporangium sp. TaxID=1925024 RepID=UPI002D77D575|nr:DUF4349 domain-containing protein [Intrasporangium sp.]HET7396976.1 DUF4349 domain-containing protein [Intrasporangium sp.]